MHDSQDQIEDTKGLNGDLGELRVTNLRLLWLSAKSRKTNISIGHNCITSVNVRSAASRLKGARARAAAEPCVCLWVCGVGGWEVASAWVRGAMQR